MSIFSLKSILAQLPPSATLASSSPTFSPSPSPLSLSAHASSNDDVHGLPPRPASTPKQVSEAKGYSPSNATKSTFVSSTSYAPLISAGNDGEYDQSHPAEIPSPTLLDAEDSEANVQQHIRVQPIISVAPSKFKLTDVLSLRFPNDSSTSGSRTVADSVRRRLGHNEVQMSLPSMDASAPSDVVDTPLSFKLHEAVQALRAQQLASSKHDGSHSPRILQSEHPSTDAHLQVKPTVADLPTASLLKPVDPDIDAHVKFHQSDSFAECWECLRCLPRLLREWFSCCCRCFEFVKVMTLEQEELLEKELRHGVILPSHAQTIDAEALTRVLSRFPPNAILGLTIQRTDLLQPSALLLHPIVRVHIVDLCTGKYVRKSDKSKSVVLPNENVHKPGLLLSGENEKSEFILPFQTGPCNLRKIGAFLPAWDETLVVNETLQYLTTPNTLFLFELLDFGPRLDLEKYSDGYYRVAWGFLKLLSVKGLPNFGDNSRLQLYQYTPRSANSHSAAFSFSSISRISRPDVPDVYFDWVFQKTAGRPRFRYPSTLYISIDGHTPLQRILTTNRPSLPTETEVGRIPFKEMARVLDLDERRGPELDSLDAARSGRRASLRRRGVSDACLIPSSFLHSLSCGQLGCFALSFSPTGRYLAAACGEKLLFTIKLYATESGRLQHTFAGHHDIIYDLCWSEDGRELLSASSDHTAKVWDTKTCQLHALQSFQHNTFVYAAQFLPKADNPRIVLTGCFDGALRVWNRDSGQLLASYLGSHVSNLNTIAVNPTGTKIFTGDADGIINVWEDTASIYSRRWRSGDAEHVVHVDSKDANSPANWSSRFAVVQKIDQSELRGYSINCLRYHPYPEALVAYARNNAVFLFSLRRFDVRKKFTGAQCRGSRLCCSISPDGQKLVAGSEDGKAYFWEMASGKLLATLDVGFSAPMFDVVWHPHEHVVAFASFGGDYPVVLFDAQSPPSAHSNLLSADSTSSHPLTVNPNASLTPTGVSTALSPPTSIRASAVASASRARMQTVSQAHEGISELPQQRLFQSAEKLDEAE